MSKLLDKYFPAENAKPEAPKASAKAGTLDRYFPQEIAPDAAQPSRQTPDGRTTAPGTTEDQAASIPPGMVFDPRTGGYMDASAEAQRMGPWRAAAATFVSGLPFIGEGFDEALGRADAAMTGRSPEIAQEVTRQSQAQFREANPVTATGLQVAGGITGSLPLAGAAVGTVRAVPGALPKVVAAMTGGGIAGGIEGASQGYLRGTNRENRNRGAAEGAVLGAGLGAALGPVSVGLGALGKEVMSRVRRLDVAVIADEFGLSPQAARLVKRFIANDDLDAAERLLARAGDDAMLADAGPGTAAALDAAAQTGGAPLRIARDAVDARARAQQPKLVGMLDDVLGAPEGRRAANTAINQRTAAARSAAYDRAYSRPIDYASDKGRAVEGVLSRVAPRTMQGAVQEANDAMRDAGVRNMQIMAEIGEDGAVTFREMPNVQQLDYLKRALGDIAEQGRDSITGQMTGAASRASSQAKALRDALRDAVPEYGTALRLGGDTIREREALDLGVNLLSERTTLEDVRGLMRNASDADKAAIRQGLRQDLERRMGAVRETLTDNSTEARQSVKAMLDTSSASVRRKVAVALGSDSKKFFDGMDQSRAALELRSAMAANSKTAIRTAGREAVDEVMEPNAVQSLLTGEVGVAARKTVGAATGFGDLPTERREQVLTEVAKVLTGLRGRKAQEALRTVRMAIEGQPVTESQARRVGEIVGSGSFVSLYQTGQQAQQRIEP